MRRSTVIKLVALVASFGGTAQGFTSISLGTPRLTNPTLGASIGDRQYNEADPFTTDFIASVSSTEPPLGRAVEIISIVTSQILSPLIASILTNGFPSDWDRFWSQGGTISNGQRIALAAEKLGPTYVKFGQALASRPDVIPKSLASALETLQDDMQPFDTETARSIIKSELETCMEPSDLELFLKSLGEEPVAAASIGQVYKGYLPGFGDVAVKVKRRGIRELVERDAVLLRSLAEWLESIPGIPTSGSNRLIATELVKAVEEFFSRIFEELDYRREAANCAEFAAIYARENRRVKTVKVVVPEVLPQFCTDNVLVMEWLEGTKLTDVDVNDLATLRENVEIISIGISCTLSQLLETGRLHADPHAGNLIKVLRPEGNQLGYLDFGILSSIPPQVRDGLVCAVSYLIFARDVDAVASLFGELQLLPPEIMEDPIERAALTAAMEITLNEALVYTECLNDTSTQIPTLKFDQLLSSLTRLIPRFRFRLPPYFINNARALSTLEGIARSLDPSFNVFQVMYPFALTKLLKNPTNSVVVDKTLQDLIRNPVTRRVDPKKVLQILKDSSLITGYSRARVLYDIVKTKSGRRLALRIVAEEAIHRNPFSRNKQTAPSTTEKRTPKFLRL